MPSFTHHIFVCGNVRPPGHKRGCCDPGGQQELREAFKQFLSGAREAAVYDSAELLELSTGAGAVRPYRAEHVTLTEGGSRFSFRGREVALRVPASTTRRTRRAR